ncbi:MAG: hypothetical protein LC650_05125 [Actinobacteria bacterium]|nr:hypothetical protein [Actinomycetota bacterium]
MLRLDSQDLQRYDAELSPGQFVMDASDLGFHPGSYPERLATNAGNEMPFVMDVKVGGRVRYKQELGAITLTVLPT